MIFTCIFIRFSFTEEGSLLGFLVMVIDVCNWCHHEKLKFIFHDQLMIFFPFRLCVILLHPCEYQERHHSSIWWTLLTLCNCVPLQFCYSKLHTHKLCTQEWASRLFPLLLLSSDMEIRILICLNNVSFCKLQTKNLWLNVCLINNLLRFYIYLNKICGIGLNNVVNVSKYFYKWDTRINSF